MDPNYFFPRCYFSENKRKELVLHVKTTYLLLSEVNVYKCISMPTTIPGIVDVWKTVHTMLKCIQTSNHSCTSA